MVTLRIYLETIILVIKQKRGKIHDFTEPVQIHKGYIWQMPM
jgi:hypothetical protein